jgi:hypothetical protein
LTTRAWAEKPFERPGVRRGRRSGNLEACEEGDHAELVRRQPGASSGYRIHYNQAGKLQFRAGVSKATLANKGTGLTSRVSYTYVATAWSDCNGNAVFDAGVDLERAPSNSSSASAQLNPPCMPGV